MISAAAVAITAATTPPTMMAMELLVLVLGLGGSVVVAMELGPTCPAEKSDKESERLLELVLALHGMT